MEFKRVNDKRYECINFKDTLEEVYGSVYGQHHVRFKDELLHDLILRILTFRIASEFFKQGNMIENKLDVLNIHIDKEYLFVNDTQLSKENMVISVGNLRDMGPDGSVETKVVFGRC